MRNFGIPVSRNEKWSYSVELNAKRSKFRYNSQDTKPTDRNNGKLNRDHKRPRYPTSTRMHVEQRSTQFSGTLQDGNDKLGAP